jgi:2-(1,2-epoxy-1,2-dihydrophenyl)acetyl-CoA isomerase
VPVGWDEPAPGVGRATLDRPERRNAYDRQLCRELLAAIERYRRDDRLRCLIVTGSGGAFCAGGDIKGDDPELEAVLATQLGWARELLEDMQAVVLALHHLDKPAVAAIDGPAVAGGLTLALMCDYRVAASSARLGDTSGRVGLLPDEGGTWIFPRVMGYERALRMVLLQEIYDAKTALELGLVSEVVPDDQLEARSVELASQIATAPPISARTVKALMRRALTGTLEQSLGDARMAVLYVNETADAREGKAAFRERRNPRFTGT